MRANAGGLPFPRVCMLLALCCAGERSDTIAQFAHTAWGTKEGAPSPITALAQTPDGYLWLGNPAGLYRFDGVAFEYFRPQSGGPFPGGVNSLLALPNGDLWIGFSGAISLLRNGNATNYTTRDGVPNGVVWSLAQDRDGTIWAATDNGLARLQGNQWKVVGKDWNFPGKSAYAVFLDRQGTLWVSTEDTVVSLPPGARQFQPANIRVGQVMQFGQAASGKLWMAETTRSVRTIPLSDRRQSPDETEVQVGSMGILFDNDGALWITSIGDGLRRSPAPDLLKGRIQEFSSAVESFSAKDGLSDDYVRAILQDREGNIWVGTNSGLDRFHKTNMVPVALPFKLNQSIWAAGDDGDVWVYELAGNRSVMVRVHGGRADRGHPLHSHNYAADNPTSAYRDASGTIWWVCLDAIYRYHAGNYTRIALPDSFPKPNLGFPPQATEDGSGALWLSAERQGLFYLKDGVWHRLESAPESAKLFPTTAFTDWMGRAWFGYLEGTIILLDQGRIQRVFSANESPLGGVQVISGRGRHVWLAGRGLAFFDGNRFRRVVPADEPFGASFGTIWGVEEASNGSLWLAEQRGVIEIPATEIQQVLRDPSYRVKYRVFDSFDGLPGIPSKEIQATDGKLWFMASKGIVRVDPANISTNALPPTVLIRPIKANGKQFRSLMNLTLPPRTTNLQISYTALSLSVPEKVRFRYRLEGVDKEWQDAGTRREAFYNGLGPGKYHFRVIACNNDGIWNDEGAHLDFTIAPAWYQTIWFRGLCVLAFCTLLWAGYRMRVHQLQEQEKIFREAVETMPALAFVADPKGNLTFMNKGWLEYTGVSPNEPSASGWEKTIHPDDLNRITEQWRASQTTGEPLDCETRLRRGLDGTHRWFLIRAVPVRDKHGKIVKWCGAATDIEDRKDAEQLRENLTHASRVSTMGELVASISHELAQPITVTTAHARASLRWLQCDPPELTEVRKGTERIMEAGTLASEIINRLRLLYKKAPPNRELVAINEVIQEMARMLGTEARRQGASIDTDLKDDLPMTVTDRVQLQQVLMNLMLNGIEAMKDEGGVLTVKSQMGEDGQIEISIQDTGPGLPTGGTNQIFDAFFTTKPQGSGMGLAISKSIVESHGGRIWANGNSERGATFHFTLPTVPAET
ncbi:two-component regulator propeller domain-containing protein [Terracidiphilus gabretensis]|uniref:two-component regulator propeller domain-containing protein n=1 Tax=Terracidiphilus gabretensis TaxID=1577687 RepID=UPI00071B1230|nr:two-component regulator propeller domain-containing protein [Terracidiphilus gabretensis]